LKTFIYSLFLSAEGTDRCCGRVAGIGVPLLQSAWPLSYKSSWFTKRQGELPEFWVIFPKSHLLKNIIFLHVHVYMHVYMNALILYTFIRNMFPWLVPHQKQYTLQHRATIAPDLYSEAFLSNPGLDPGYPELFPCFYSIIRGKFRDRVLKHANMAYFLNSLQFAIYFLSLAQHS
jgi:hypothetical protein